MLHLAVISCTWHSMNGADRDWVTLANALEGDGVRITWFGITGCAALRRYLNPRVVPRLIDLDLPGFGYVLGENARQERSAWLWTKILGDHVLRLGKPLARLHRALRNDPADLVVSNTAAVTVGAAYAWLHRLPHVWCIKECLNRDLSACRRFARFISRASSAVVAPSQAVAGVFPPGVRVLADGSDVQHVLQGGERGCREQMLGDLGLPAGQPVVAQTGSLVYWKGQHVTAEAFVRLAREGRCPPFSLLFLGPETPAQKQEVLRILEGAPPSWRAAVRFHRFAPDDFSYLACADVVVHPSVLPDPFPNAVREAMILGKPVIGSRGGGIPEMIEDGRTGLLVDPGRAGPLAEAMARLVTSPGARQALGAAAARHAAEHFDIRETKRAFLSLLRGLAPRKANGRGTVSAALTTHPAAAAPEA